MREKRRLEVRPRVERGSSDGWRSVMERRGRKAEAPPRDCGMLLEWESRVLCGAADACVRQRSRGAPTDPRSAASGGV